MRDIQSWWDEFASRTIDPAAPENQRQDMEMAFKCGAYAILCDVLPMAIEVDPTKLKTALIQHFSELDEWILGDVNKRLARDGHPPITRPKKF
jgi:hypothetical protein